MKRLIAQIDVVPQGVLVYFKDGHVALLSEDDLLQLAVSTRAFSAAEQVEGEVLLERLVLLPFNPPA